MTASFNCSKHHRVLTEDNIQLTRKSSTGDIISELDSDGCLYGKRVAASADKNSLDMHSGTKSVA